jgi:GNAT superfamily N-acetyltransferase
MRRPEVGVVFPIIAVRALQQIERVRHEKGGRDLLEQLCWRITVLGGQVDLTEPVLRSAFSEVMDAYAPENHELVLDPSSRCLATLERGGEIDFTGILVTGGTVTAELERCLHLGRRFAEHRRLRVLPKYRGNRIGPRCLIQSVKLYDELGFEHVHLRAAFSGTWYWALWGFHFESRSEMERVQAHAQEIIDAFGGGLDATSLTHPIQFARLGEPTTLTFDELCDALPQRRDAYEDLAQENGLGMHDPVPFGRLVLLTGPSWYGRLDMSGGDRLIFDDRARRVLAALEGGV